MEIFDSVRERLGLRGPIRLLSHVRLDSPVVVGWLRPVVLLPVSLISGFTPEQLSAILAHELAHIRRHDFVVNVLQRSVESILFYHPAVWWLSKRIRAEREHCCDDIAIRLCGSRKIYAEVLIEMERARQPRPILSVAAADGAVLERFRRVLGMSTSVVDWQSAVGTALFLGVWVVVGMWQSASTIQAAPAVALKPELAPAPILPPVPAPAAVAESVNAIAAILTAQPVVQVPAAAPAQPGVISGIVRTSTGVPLEGIYVALAPVNPSIAGSKAAGAATNSAGRYQLKNVSPGRYHIVIGAGTRFYHPGVTDLGRATAIEVAAGATIEVPDTVAPGGTVTGRVALQGKLRVDNMVLCCDSFRGKYLFRNSEGDLVASSRQGIAFMPTLSDDGSFVFEFVPAGNYVLLAENQHTFLMGWALAVGANGATGIQPDVPEDVEVQGTVLDPTGKPVPASVQLRPRPASSLSNAIGPPNGIKGGLQVSKNPDGTVTLTGIGNFLPRVAPSLDEVQNWLQAYAARSATVGSDGLFRLWAYPGAYLMEVSSNGVTLPGREIQVGIEGVKNISFQVPAIQPPVTQVTGRVVAPNGGPLPKLNYIRFVRSGSGNDVFYGFPDTEGRFSLTLSPGEYRLLTERLGRPVQSVSDGSRDITNAVLTVVAGRNPQIVVTIEP
jgi:hypothetical protein